MLKSKVTNAEFEALNDVLKAEYKKVGDDYFLDSDDAGELRRAKDRETEEAKKQKQRADDLEAKALEDARKANEAAAELAKKNGDITALEASWKKKHDDDIAEMQKQLDASNGIIKRVFVDNIADNIAHEISTSPLLINPHIKSRLRVELVDGEPVTRVLDANNKPTALTLDDLKKEFVANENFAAIIVGSKASGGGAGQNRGGGGAHKKISEMNEQERVAFFNVNPDEFNRRVHAGE